MSELEIMTMAGFLFGFAAGVAITSILYHAFGWVKEPDGGTHD